MIPSVLRDLAGSEKAVFCLALIAASSVLTAMGQMTMAEWQDYTKWIAGIYVGGKAIEGAATSVARARAGEDKGKAKGRDK
jgi:hypothetical protein